VNYRHIYHAGNFADVMKHAVLARIVEYLTRKEKAFRVIDTHAGTGLYDLKSEAAGRTREWRDGIGRVMAAQFPEPVATLLAPYLDAVRSANGGRGLRHYPGSPLIARHLMRKQDRLTAIELHPRDAATLRDRFAGDYQTRVIELDGWLALGAHVPPKEKRGLVLVDPPFEEEGEFERLTEGLKRAHRRWPGGTYVLWYPVKDRKAVDAFRRAIGEAGIASVLDAALEIRPPSAEPRLDGSGLIVVNPPYPLESELRLLLPALAEVLAREDRAAWRLDWLAGEAASP